MSATPLALDDKQGFNRSITEHMAKCGVGFLGTPARPARIWRTCHIDLCYMQALGLLSIRLLAAQLHTPQLFLLVEVKKH